MEGLKVYEGFEVKRNEVYISSREVSKILEKRHDNILRDIRGKSSLLNFEEWFKASKYKANNNQEYDEYLLTKDGFTLLVFSYNGNDEFKEAYINKFNSMENFINTRLSTEWQKTRRQGKLTRRKETDIIAQQLIPLAQEQGSKNYKMFYANYSKLVNKITGLDSGMRDIITDRTLRYIEILEDIIEKTIQEETEKGSHYKDIYQLAKHKCELFKGISAPPKQLLISEDD